MGILLECLLFILMCCFKGMSRLTIIFAPVLLMLSACMASSPIIQELPEESETNQFDAVWGQVKSDPLDDLPQVKVSYGKLAAHGRDIILSDANRTLKSRADIIPYFEKLAHPNGICFKGVWNITAENKYSGYFKKDSKALIVVRASSAMSNTTSGQLRSFGFAGKIFPTMDPQSFNIEKTANFFLIDDLGGTRAAHYTEVELSNSPAASITSEVVKSFLYVAKLARTFSKSDENPTIRQVYEISQLGEKGDRSVITPRWMKVQALPGQVVNESDFRDELRINNENLVFKISVASETVNDSKNWLDIGLITLDTSVVSSTCDHRLHFHHPKWRSDLEH